MLKPPQTEQKSDRLFIGGCAVGAIVQWYQIIYRVELFFTQHHGHLGENHIGDGDFRLIYLANAVLLAVAIISIRIYRQNRLWLRISITVCIINLLGCLTLFIMHRTGVLVEYMEFMRNARTPM